MFACSLRPGSEPHRKADVASRLSTLRDATDSPIESLSAGAFNAAASPAGRRPLIAGSRSLAAVGDVRIDNRSEIAELAGGSARGESDLALLLRAYAAHGDGVVSRLAGDFAFVIWDARAQKLLAARDAFGVRPLYYMQRDGELMLASHVGALPHGGGYDLHYIANFVSGQPIATERTLHADVQSVAAGGMLVQRGTVLRRGLHWTVDAFEPRDGSATMEDVEQFRSLLVEAVRVQSGAAHETWAHLSGGLDSSSIVAVAAKDGAGLAGTLTVVDTLGAGDERAFSDEVAQQFGVRNEQVVDYWAWQEDGAPPPELDQPWPLFPFYARDRRMRSVVRNSGARVVLAGVGADHYLTGNLGYISDLLARGQRRRALTELATWAAGTRQSFWGLGNRLIAKPAFSRILGQREAFVQTPAWLRPGVARLAGDAVNDGAAPRSAFAAGIAREMRALPAWIERYPYGAETELRYPFLYRPLVEFALTLPADGRIRGLRTKWVLREAMRGTLPDRVRTRSTKGGIDARVLWSLNRESARVDALLRDPLLAGIGAICGDSLRSAVLRARQGICENPVHLLSTLALESWLAVRAGSSAMSITAASHAA